MIAAGKPGHSMNIIVVTVAQKTFAEQQRKGTRPVSVTLGSNLTKQHSGFPIGTVIHPVLRVDMLWLRVLLPLARLMWSCMSLSVTALPVTYGASISNGQDSCSVGASGHGPCQVVVKEGYFVGSLHVRPVAPVLVVAVPARRREGSPTRIGTN